MTSVRGNDAGEPRIDMTFWPLPDSALRSPDVSTSASGRAPRAIPSAARIVPRLVPMTVTGRLIAAILNRAIEIGACVDHEHCQPARRIGVSRADQLVEFEPVNFAVVARI